MNTTPLPPTSDDFALPPDEELDALSSLLEPWRMWTSPAFFGWENIPTERPLLFVGNHTIYGLLDVPFLFLELYKQKQIFLRALGHHFHFKVPLWRDFLQRYGVVQGTRDNVSVLMEAGESILVFPGGGREVAKCKGERYELIWKERLGFVRMAVKYGCTIVPFAAVGAEEMFEIVVDSKSLLDSALGPLLRTFKVKDEYIMPLAKGIGPTPLPKPERFYFWFGPPIPTRALQGQEEDTTLCQELRDEVRTSILDGIDFLQTQRANDPDRLLPQRLLRQVQRAFRSW